MKKFGSVTVLIIFDLFLYFAALWLAYQIRANITLDWWIFNFRGLGKVKLSEFVAIYWIPVTLVALYFYEGIYFAKKPFWIELKSMLKAVVLGSFAIYAFLGFAKMPSDYSRFIVVSTIVIWLFLSALSHNLVRKIFYTLKIFQRDAVLIGNRKFYKLVRKSLHENSYLNFNVNAWVVSKAPKNFKNPNVSVLEFSDNLDWKDISQKCPHLAVQERFARKNYILMQKLLLLFSEIYIIPEDYHDKFLNSELIFLFSQKVSFTKVQNNLKSVWSRLTKELFDRILGTIIFIFSTPILLASALLIKMDSQGSVFIEKNNPARKRIGKNGKIFETVKFRTMVVDENGKLHTKLLKHLFKTNPKEKKNWKKYKKIIGDDPRVTRIGKVLRTTSIDSLSEIVNVMKGQMSLVGPRPYLPREKDEMEGYFDTIVSVKPGMTGLWQISGRNELTFNDRMKLDIWYIHNWSVWLDMIILMKTIFVVLSRRGAR